MTARYSTALRNAQLDAITTAVGSAGKLTIYAGTQPATGGTATTQLAQFTLGTPFAGSAGSGSLSPNLPSDVAAGATGTATWARITTSGGTFVMDLTVGTSGTDVVLNSTGLNSGVTCSVTGFSITAGNP